MSTIPPNDTRERWALILGASSGFGAATARSLARAGYAIVGVHLDLRATKARADSVRDEIAAIGVPVVFHNVNAADEEKRRTVIEDTRRRFEERRAAGASHSSPSSSTRSPSVPPSRISRPTPRSARSATKQLEMTADVMAHSMVYWVRDLFHAGLLADGSRLFAMTSEGAVKVVPTYGPVSAAKAALESHCRQLALELIPTASPSTRSAPG
jgi:enoyl-[acyl-carrier protein] reductase III